MSNLDINILISSDFSDYTRSYLSGSQRLSYYIHDNLNQNIEIASGFSIGNHSDEKNELLKELIELFDFSINSNFPAKSLAHHHLQWLEILMIIHTGADVLLLDEPTSALDPLTTLFIEELMDALKKQCTIIIVTHNMQQAARVSDYTAFFHQGRLIEYADSDTLFTMPDKKQTEDYITGRYG